jgi:mannose-1-phosphate guanylyltransferase/mannose-6-phosphate isomerase
MKYVILAGGSGSRLWPLSREKFAKQFLKLTNDKSMLQNTALRVSKENGRDIFVISNAGSACQINSQLKEVLSEYDASNYITEPVGRNTCPAIAYGLLFFQPDDVIAILSSDHDIRDNSRFNEILAEAEKIALENYIVTLGILPDSPKTGYGYIKKGVEKKSEGYRVENFFEKPDIEKAREYLKNGSYFWNAGIFIFKVRTFLEELKKHSPDIFSILEIIRIKKENKQEISIEDFNKFPRISVDYAVMEKSDKIVVIPSDFGWSDIGSFKALYEIKKKDIDGNAVSGLKSSDFISINSKNLLLYGNNRKTAVIGINNLSIIDTDDALLVTDNEHAEDVKKVFEELVRRHSPEYSEHKVKCFEWGTSNVIENENDYCINKLVFNTGGHATFNNEKFDSNLVIIQGDAEIKINGIKNILNINDNLKIGKNSNFEILNLNKKKLVIIEILHNAGAVD